MILLALATFLLASCQKDWKSYECGCYNTDVSANPVLEGESWSKKFPDDSSKESYEEKQTKKVKDKQKASWVECFEQ